MRLSVVGVGYLGATHAACMAELGHEVLAVDTDARKVAALQSGRAPLFEPGLDTLLQRHTASGRLRFTTDLREVAGFARVHFLAVGTPQVAGGLAADTSFLDDATSHLSAILEGEHLVVGKSTVPVGTARCLQERFPDSVEVAWNPEFLREGHAVKDTLAPDRIVVGQRPGGRAEQVLREVYATPIEQGSPMLVTDLPTAELVKVAANAFLATKISFINAVAEVCDAAGADVTQLADAIGMDARIGRQFLNAGLGFGGGCLPKDVRAFIARADELGAGDSVRFLREVDAINQGRRARVVDLARRELGTLEGRTIAVLGAAFKPNSDDIRDSPALDVAQRLHDAGAHVRVHDPKALDNARAAYPDLDVPGTLAQTTAGADLCILATEWDAFLEPLVGVDKRVIIDARNALDVPTWQQAGWRVIR